MGYSVVITKEAPNYGLEFNNDSTKLTVRHLGVVVRYNLYQITHCQ